ncbi:uncharacterized protein LOC124387786 isoform X1 [Silurus meridionalis]|uniref:uncharacterized protein LOC124387786 isoform X1 n=1 Tax=Silurus meridionalis TaxID=175797 RepID=UPI001EEBD2CE|nr:uncharacterized protein LOC124387786 isoform X1 [Silurus meridionalis]
MIRYQELLLMENKAPPSSDPGTSTGRSETSPRDSLEETKKMEELKETMVHGQKNLNEGWMAAALLNTKSIITKFYSNLNTFDGECSDDYREMDSSESSSHMTVLESLTAFPRGGHVSSLTPSLFPISHVHTLTEGLTNFGFNCYVNASLQCLFTAETFCGELSNLLDNSFPKVDDTLIRCFVELSRLRNGLKGGHKINKDSLLKDLILSATMINPEFTIDQQNDAHEFLCFCLSEIEEFILGHVGKRMWNLDVQSSPISSST